jgi:hypothetical protein
LFVLFIYHALKGVAIDVAGLAMAVAIAINAAVFAL